MKKILLLIISPILIFSEAQEYIPQTKRNIQNITPQITQNSNQILAGESVFICTVSKSEGEKLDPEEWNLENKPMEIFINLKMDQATISDKIIHLDYIKRISHKSDAKTDVYYWGHEKYFEPNNERVFYIGYTKYGDRIITIVFPKDESGNRTTFSYTECIL